LVYKGRYGACGQQRSDELGNEGITRGEKRRIGPGDRVEDVEDEEAFIIKEVPSEIILDSKPRLAWHSWSLDSRGSIMSW
jgi:hypothetical protein